MKYKYKLLYTLICSTGLLVLSPTSFAAFGDSVIGSGGGGGILSTGTPGTADAGGDALATPGQPGGGVVVTATPDPSGGGGGGGGDSGGENTGGGGGPQSGGENNPPVLNVPHRVDSSQLNRGVTKPSTGSMQIVTQVAVPCNVTMAQIETWIANQSHVCSGNNTADLCFVQLKAVQGPGSTQNVLNCPSYYSPLFSYGTSIADANNPGTALAYFPGDTQTMLTSDKYSFYVTQQHYTPSDDAGATPIVINSTKESGHTTGPSKPGYDHNVGDYTSFNSIYVHVVDRTRDCDCYTEPKVSAPDSTCNGGIVAGAYWECDFTYTGQPQKAVRVEGFYPETTNPAYTMPQASSKYAPTILMCGKNFTRWKAVSPTGHVDPNACVPLPP